MADVAPDVENMKVNMEDFLSALQEVPPSFGVSETELQQCVQNGVISFGEHIEVSICQQLYYLHAYFICSIANLGRWQIVCRSSTRIRSHSCCQCIGAWTSWKWQDCIGSNYCIGE